MKTWRRPEGGHFGARPRGRDCRQCPANGGIIVSQVMGTWSGKDIRIAGNAVGNTLFNWLVIDGYTSIDGLTVQDNAYHDAGGEYKLRAENDVSGYVFSGNEEAGVDQWLVKRLGK